MYGKIAVFHQTLTDRLSGELGKKVFPHVSLFSGPRFSGRMSLVLETCRIIACQLRSEDTCTCRACTQSHILDWTNIVIVASRDHALMFEALCNAYDEKRTAELKNLLIRNTKILLLQFHEALLGSSSQKHQSFDAASLANERLMDFTQSAENESGTTLKALRDAVKPIVSSSKKTGSISIGHVRLLQEWASKNTLDGSKKFIILEGVESSNDASRNSLLKFLEEPPEDTYIFLLSDHPSTIPQTILSRVRHYQVPAISSENKNRLISTVFHEEGKTYDSVETLILTKAGYDCQQLLLDAHSYIDKIVSPNIADADDISALVTNMDEIASFDYFLQMIVRRVIESVRANRMPVAKAIKANRAISEAKMAVKVFNQQRRLALESLFYRLREVLGQ